MNTKKIMIIDGNSILNRAFYGTDILTTPKGVYTNAVLGFLNIMQKYIKEEEPGSMCVAFDLKAPTFRHREYAEYKKQREGMPKELADQLPLVKEILDAMGIKRLEVQGYEADDIMGSVAKSAKNSGYDVVIVTGDRDALQLVDEKVRVKIIRTKMGKTVTDEYTVDKIKADYGIEPRQLIEIKGLMGDTSDNIPGVRGIGPKTALKLIQEFGNIDNIYNNIDKITQRSIIQNLIVYREFAILSRRLGTIYEDLDVEFNDLDFSIKGYDRPRLYKILEELKFNSLIDKLGLRDEGYALNKVERNIKDITDKEGLEKLINMVTKKRKLYFYYRLDVAPRIRRELKYFIVAIDDIFYNVDFDSISSDKFLKLFACVFEDATVEKYTYSAKDMYLLLFTHDIELKNLKFDITVAAYIVDSCMKNFDVHIIADRFLDVRVPDVLAQDGVNTKEILVEYTALIKDMVSFFEKEIHKNNQDVLYYDIELPLVEVLASLEFWGFKVDKQELKNMSEELDKKLKVISQEIYEIAGEEFNLNSPRQLGKILGEKLGLPLKKGKQSYSTDLDSLLPLKDDNKIVSLVIDYRKLAKLKSTYADGISEKIYDSDGKVHSTFNQTATVTGRISSTEPNLQNIPIRSEEGRLIRKLFVPENQEFVFLDADYSQIELRVLAHVTKDENLMKAFLNNEDVHAATASKIFGVDKKDVTKELRGRAKTINFGIVYGMGEHNLSKDLGISVEQAKEYIDNYFRTHNKVKEYSLDIIEQAKESGYVSTIFNRMRPLPELKAKNRRIYTAGKRAAINAPIQGSAADIIKIAMVKVYNELKSRKLKSRLILQVHDELLIETHVDEIDEVRNLLVKCMEEAAQLDVPLVVEVKEGASWFEAK